MPRGRRNPLARQRTVRRRTMRRRLISRLGIQRRRRVDSDRARPRRAPTPRAALRRRRRRRHNRDHQFVASIRRRLTTSPVALVTPRCHLAGRST